MLLPSNALQCCHFYLIKLAICVCSVGRFDFISFVCFFFFSFRCDGSSDGVIYSRIAVTRFRNGHFNGNQFFVGSTSYTYQVIRNAVKVWTEADFLRPLRNWSENLFLSWISIYSKKKIRFICNKNGRLHYLKIIQLSENPCAFFESITNTINFINFIRCIMFSPCSWVHITLIYLRTQRFVLNNVFTEKKEIRSLVNYYSSFFSRSFISCRLVVTDLLSRRGQRATIQNHSRLSDLT